VANLLVLILDEPAHLPAILDRWRAIGVPGTTILRSLGGFGLTSWLDRVGLGMLGRAFEAPETEQRVILSLMDDDAILERAIAEAEQIVGGFDRPKSGLLFVLPVPRTLGLKGRAPAGAEAAPAPPFPLREAAAALAFPVSRLLDLPPRESAVVHPQDTLPVVAAAMADQPGNPLACVVNDEGRLVGLIRLETVVADLFMELMPEAFLGDLSELGDALQYAGRLTHRTAGDAMEPATSVKSTDTLRTAYKAMHSKHLSVIPAVDETHHVVGFVALANLLAAVCKDAVIGCNRSEPQA